MPTNVAHTYSSSRRPVKRRSSGTASVAVCLLAAAMAAAAAIRLAGAAAGEPASAGPAGVAGEALARSKRGLPFLQGAGNGYIIAIALPIGNGRRHVFTAFNFEIHFGLADNSTFSPTGLITRWQGKRSVDSAPPADNNVAIDAQPAARPPQPAAKPAKSAAKRNMLTRRHVYRVIETQLNRAGRNGTACLLKTICHTAESDLAESNGVFGNLFHVVFTPTASRDEGLPQFFYEAEARGAAGDCRRWYGEDECPRSLLEQVSTVLELFE